MNITIDPGSRRVAVTGMTDFRSMYSDIKDQWASSDYLIMFPFPFVYVGDLLLLDEGWSLSIDGEIYQGAKIVEFQV